MQIWKYICLYIKGSITYIAHYNTVRFLRYPHFRYLIYASERLGRSSKGGEECLFEGGVLSRETLIKYIKKTLNILK